MEQVHAEGPLRGSLWRPCKFESFNQTYIIRASRNSIDRKRASLEVSFLNLDGWIAVCLDVLARGVVPSSCKL